MSNIKENIENFIDAIKVGSYNEAQSIFSGLMNDKLQDRLEAEKIAVAGSIFNGADEDIFFEELDELEEAKKYKKEEEEEDDDLDVDVDEVEDDEDDDEDEDEDELDDEDDDDDEEELDEISKELAKRAFDARAKRHRAAQSTANQLDKKSDEYEKKRDSMSKGSERDKMIRKARDAYHAGQAHRDRADKMASKLDRSARKAGMDDKQAGQRYNKATDTRSPTQKYADYKKKGGDLSYADYKSKYLDK